ncbi:hypothetical protein HGRIS_008728 [Hohenbuehelia grisea]|uniref:Uncharacterized protein n=1 Tax=Hohenbuehelia grisea TaxID=104357 RepID=A0ABR3J9D8_9AGAR
MKFTNFVTLLFVSGYAVAQNAFIGAPSEGASIKADSYFTVEVDRPNSLTGSEEIAVAISLLHCGGDSCPPPTDVLGTTLYKGPYSPQLHSETQSKPPYQNFSVYLPYNFQKGKAQLSVSHLTFIGAGPFPFFEVKNTTINVI